MQVYSLYLQSSLEFVIHGFLKLQHSKCTIDTAVGQKIVENQDVANAVRELNACKQNVQRISLRLTYSRQSTVQLITRCSYQEKQVSMSSNVGILLLPSADATLFVFAFLFFSSLLCSHCEL